MIKSRKKIWYFPEVDIKYSECFDTLNFAFNGAGREKFLNSFLVRVRVCA